MNRAARVAVNLRAAALALACSVTQAAQDLSWGGFVQSHLAARVNGVACSPGTACDFPAAEIRGQVQAEGKNPSGNAAFFGRFDLIRDLAVDDTRLVARELFGGLSSERATARLGRQVITWGVGDLLFVNDTFPRDWVALFTGQPVQYLKLGSDALKLNAYPGGATVEAVIAGFRPDNTPSARRFVFADPLPPGLPRHAVEPGARPGTLEISGRISGYWDNWELAGYASRTHYRSPAWRVAGSAVAGTYPRLNTMGASLTGPMGKGVLALEAGYYDSAEDRSGKDPAVENSQYRALVGYSRQLWADAILGLQLYGEAMRDYGGYRGNLPPGFPVKDRLRKVATVRFTRLFAHQTVTFNLFAFIGLSEKDHYLMPSLRYAFTDDLWAEIGANFFGGARTGMFGSMRDNDNIYLTVRHAF